MALSLSIHGNSLSRAEEQLLGLSVNGLQGTLSVEKKSSSFQDIKVTLSLMNVSDSPVEIDPWPDNWFITVFDEKMNVVSNFSRAADQMRPFPKPKILKPGEKWDVKITGLKLKTGLGDSSPDWEYFPLKPGIYYLGAEYTAMASLDHPKMWAGALNTRLSKIQVVSPLQSVFRRH